MKFINNKMKLTYRRLCQVSPIPLTFSLIDWSWLFPHPWGSILQLIYHTPLLKEDSEKTMAPNGVSNVCKSFY